MVKIKDQTKRTGGGSMTSQIKTFRVDAGFKDRAGIFDFETAEQEILERFDEWRTEEMPIILAINFGRRSGNVIESPHYWYIQVLYDIKK